MPGQVALGQLISQAQIRVGQTAATQAVAGGLGTGLLGSLASTGLIGLGVLGASYAVQLLFRQFRDRPAEVNPHSPGQATRTVADAPYTWVIGRQRVGMRIATYAGGDGANTLIVAGVLGEGPFQGNAGVAYIEGRRVELEKTADANGDIWKPPNRSRYGPDTTMSTSDPGRQIRAQARFQTQEFYKGDGTQGAPLRTPGKLEATNDDNEPTLVDFDASEVLYYGERLADFADSARRTTTPYDATNYVQLRLADGTTRNFEFVTVLPPWSAQHRLDGRAWATYTLFENNYGQFGEEDGSDPLQQYEDEQFWGRFPPIELLVDGYKLPSFKRWKRTASTPGVYSVADPIEKDAAGNNIVETVANEFTTNAAAVMYWFQRERRGHAAGMFDEASVCEAYDVCEEEVTVQSSNLPATFRTGPNARRFNLESDGSHKSKRYTVDMTIQSTDSLDDVEDQLRMCWGGGPIVYNGDKLVFRPAKRRATTHVFTDDDVLGVAVGNPIPELGDRFTTIVAQLSQNAANDYLATELPPFTDTSAETRDMETRIKNLTLRGVVDPIVAARLIALILRKTRLGFTMNVTVRKADMSHLTVLPGDEIGFTLSDFRFADKKFEVEATRFDPVDRSAIMTVREAVAGTYADTLVVPPLPDRPVRLPEKAPVPALVGLAGEVIVGVGADGSVSQSVKATWTSKAVSFTEVQLRVAGRNPADEWQVQTVTGNSAWFRGLSPKASESFDLWARHEGKWGWTKITVAAPGDATAPGAPTNTDINAFPQAVEILWTPPSDDDYAGALIFLKKELSNGDAPTAPTDSEDPYDEAAGKETRRWTGGGLEAGEKYYGWVASVDTSGNRSAVVATDPAFATPTVQAAGDQNIWHQLASITDDSAAPTDAGYPNAGLGDLYIGRDGRLWRKTMASGGWEYTGIDMTPGANQKVIPAGDVTGALPTGLETDGLVIGSLAIANDGRYWRWTGTAWEFEGDLTGPPGPVSYEPSEGECGFVPVLVWPPRSDIGADGDVGYSVTGDYGVKADGAWPSSRQGNLQVAAFGNIQEEGYRPIVRISSSFPPTPQELARAGYRIYEIVPGVERVAGLPAGGDPIFIGANGLWGIRARGAWDKKSPDLCTGLTVSTGRVPATPILVDAIPATTVIDALGRDGAMILNWRDSGDDSITSFRYATKLKTATTYGAWTTVTAPSGVQPYDVTGVSITGTNDSAYDIILQAVNATGNSLRATAQGTPTDTFNDPVAPYQLVGIGGNNSVNWRWGRNFDPLVTGFRYKMWPSSAGLMPDEPTNWTMVPGGVVTTFASNLTMTTEDTPRAIANGTRYVIEMQAIAVSGSVTKYSPATTAYITPMAFVKPAKPAGLSAAPGNGYVDLDWDNPNDPRIDRYTFQRRQRAVATPENPWPAWPVAVTALPVGVVATRRHRDLDVTNGTEYQYRISASDGYGQTGEAISDWSDPASAIPSAGTVSITVPAAPAMVAHTRTGNLRMAITWQDPDDGTVTGHKAIVQAQDRTSSNTVSEDWRDIKTISVAAGNYYVNIDLGASDVVKPSTVHQRLIRVYIVATNERGDSPRTLSDWSPHYSNATGFVAGYLSSPNPFTIPDGFQGYTTAASGYVVDLRASVGNAQATLRWQQSQDDARTGYRILGANNRTVALLGATGVTVGKTVTSYEVTGMTNGLEYRFDIQTIGGLGATSSVTHGFPVRLLGVTPSGTAPEPGQPGNAPAQPQNFTATPGNTVVELGWTALGDSTVTKWQRRRKAGAGSYGQWRDIRSSSATTTSHRETGLTNGINYCFQVRAVNASGNGTASREQCATPSLNPPARDARAPIPTAGDGQVALAWNIHSDRTVSSYQARYRRNDSSTYSGWTTVSRSRSDITGTVTGLTNGVAYRFQVRAVNGGGGAPASRDSEPVTPMAATVTLTVPSIRDVGSRFNVGGGGVPAHWQFRILIGSVTGASGYQYRYNLGSAPTGAWSSTDPSRRAIHVNSNSYVTGTTIYFEARAVRFGDTGPSGALQVTFAFPQPIAPSIALTPSSHRGITVSLTPATEPTGYPAITSYQYQVKRFGTSFPWPTTWTTLPGGVASGAKQIPWGVTGQSIQVRVRAVSSTRVGDNRFSGPSNIVRGLA